MPLIYHFGDTHTLQMPYDLSVSVANPEAVLHPECNISDRGVVPTKLSSWTLRLTCTRKLTTEVNSHFLVILFFTSPSILTLLIDEMKKL